MQAFPDGTVTLSLGARNYQQPQIPTANMADAELGRERYTLYMQY